MLAVDMQPDSVVRKRLIPFYAGVYRGRRRRLGAYYLFGVVPYVVFRVQVVIYKLLESIVQRREIYVLTAYVLYAADVIVRKPVVTAVFENYIFLRYVVHVTSTTFRLSCNGTYSIPVRFWTDP